MKCFLQKPTVKNINHVKYSKHEAWVNDNGKHLIETDRIYSACVLEQGNDIIKDRVSKQEQQREYAIVKMYFKNQEELEND